MSLVKLSQAQMDALDRLKAIGWTLDLSTMQNLPCELAISICCKGQSGMLMYFVIEPDGYTHS
jgi:hypothetical protein